MDILLASVFPAAAKHTHCSKNNKPPRPYGCRGLSICRGEPDTGLVFPITKKNAVNHMKYDIWHPGDDLNVRPFA